MHEHRLVLLYGVFYEVVDCLCHRVLLVEYHSRLEVHPLEGQISDASPFPVVWDFSTSTVDDVSHFVSHDKLLVLSRKAISNEETIFDFNCAYHVLRELHHSLVHHLLHLHLILRRHVLGLLPGRWILNLLGLFSHYKFKYYNSNQRGFGVLG